MLHAFGRIGQATLLSITLMCVATVAWAHQLRPALAELTFVEDGTAYTLEVQTNVEAMIARIGPGHDDTDESANADEYNRLRALSAEALEAEFTAFAPEFLQALTITAGDARLMPEIMEIAIPPVGDETLARDSIITIGGPLPTGVEAVTISWDAANGPIVVRTPLDENGEGFSAFLTGGETSDPIPVTGARTDALSAFITYIGVGFDHILPKGLDHILFVVGLFLLSTKLRPLLIQITSFTAAHTVTLALGALGIVTLPGSIVEPLIALSIVYVAVENIVSDKLQRWRPVVVFMFGLLHGLGFAGVLAEFGLAPGQFIASLIAFNIGVELGQLTVVALCFAAVGYWFGGKPYYRRSIVIPGSVIIALIGAYWVVERTLL